MKEKNKNSQPEPSPANTDQERFQKVLRGNLVNIGRKVVAGTPLSEPEVRYLQGIAGESTAPARFARNQVELADALGVSRKTIQRHMRQPGHPRTRSDNRYDISAWRAYLGKGDPGDDAADEWNAERSRQLTLQNAKLEHDITELHRQYVPAADVRRWTAELNADVTRIVRGISKHAPALVTLSVAAAETKLRDIEDNVLEKFHLLHEQGSR